jgi:hypothetical protein
VEAVTTRQLTQYQLQRVEAAQALDTGTHPIAKFLAARFKEDEAVAHEAAQAIGDGEWGPGDRQVRSSRLAVVADTAVPHHIAHHDPARVLREVAAKRRILDDIVPIMNATDEQINSEWGVGPMAPGDYESVELLKILALPYVDHPDYNPEWSTA